jgi:hypothetical protein
MAVSVNCPSHTYNQYTCTLFIIRTSRVQLYSSQHAEIDGFAYLCQALMQVSSLEAILVLNPSTGKFLKHCQFCRDPRYKTTWDTSYANELGRLCQGIGTGPSPNTKWVGGTNTFFLIDYYNIQCHK